MINAPESVERASVPDVASVTDIASELADGMPPVQDYVKPSAQEAQQAPLNTAPDTVAPPSPKQGLSVEGEKLATGKVDRYRRPFNPAWHVMDAQGRPVFTKNGNLKIKGKDATPQAKPSASRLDAHHIGGPGAAEATRKAAEEILNREKVELEASQRRASAALFVMLITGSFQQVFDPEEWQPSDMENDMMLDATDRYFASQGISDVPPGWAFIGAFAGYALPRLARPKTREKVTKIADWAAIKMGKKATSPVAIANEKPKNVPTREQYEAQQAKADEVAEETEGGFSPVNNFYHV